MGRKQTRVIKPGERLKATYFRSDDTLLSIGDILIGGPLLYRRANSPEKFAVGIICLSHMLTRIVLSDRIVFFGESESYDDPVVKSLQKNCSTVIIDENHAVPAAVIQATLNAPGAVLNADLIADVQASITWHSEVGFFWLAEYAAACTIGIPFAPNPFLSEPFGVHAARALSSSEILVRYVEDLRRSTTEESNLLRQLAVYDVQLPAIFAAVIRESKSPSDLIRVAAEMNADAGAFREWCRELDVSPDPKVFNERLRAAQASLDRLGRTIRTDGSERMQVPVPAGPGGAINLPSNTLKKIVDWLDVDVGFARPRHFLLNLLASARQVKHLRDELARVFDVSPDFAAQAADWLITTSTARKTT